MDDRRILVTGVTGTVGPHLLAALLDRAERGVTCLVRASSEEAARSRIEAALSAAGHDAGRLMLRVRAQPGDLGLAHLGLSREERDALVRETAHVVHNAAWLGQRETFSPDALTNVAGTNAIVQLCLEANARLDHVSTIGVLRWTGEDDSGCLHEEAFSEHPEPPVRGGPYAHYFSKWMAEQLAIYASSKVPVTIHRLGDVFSASGDAPISALVGALGILRAVPDEDELAWAPHSIPDVFAGRAMAAIALLPNEGLRVLHDLAYVEGITVPHVRRAFADRGITLKAVPKADWMRALRADVPWVGMLAEWQIEYLLEPKRPTPRYVNDAFRACLERAGLALPSAEDRLRPFMTTTS